MSSLRSATQGARWLGGGGGGGGGGGVCVWWGGEVWGRLELRDGRVCVMVVGWWLWDGGVVVWWNGGWQWRGRVADLPG